MKQTILVGGMFLLSCIGFAFLVQANDQEELIAHAHQEYAAKNYKKAYEQYNQVANKGPAVWYNLGNCAFRLEQYGDAFVFWQRARRNAPLALQKWCTYNSNYVQEKLGVARTTQSPVEKIVDLLAAAVTVIPLIFWQLIFLILWYVIWFYCRSWYCNKRFALIATAVSVLSLVLGALVVSYKKETATYICVGNTAAQVYAVPGKEFDVVGAVPPHTLFAIRQQEGGWYKIHTPALAGWLAQESVISI